MAEKVTLVQIAEVAGCSVNAVSRALRDKPDISEETRVKIKEIAEKMGYVANYSAQALRIGKTNTVAVIMPDLLNPSYAILANEIELCMSAFGYSVIIMSSNGFEEKEKKAVTTALGKGVDGVIICPVSADTEGMRMLLKANIPFVSVEKHIGYPEGSYVIRDDTRGGYLAMEHLTTLGHSDILVIMKDKNDFCTQQKIDGIVGFCLSSGKSFDESKVCYIKADDEVEKVVDKALIRNRFSAVLCGDDITALHVSSMLINSGYKIPEDISVLCFGNLQSRIVSYPLLTTVTIPYDKLSMDAAEILIAKINGEEINSKRVLPVKIEIKNSTAYLNKI